MKKIADLLRLPVIKGDFGIEIEVEGENLVPTVASSQCPWKTEDDGSLRGRFPDQRAEYVLNKPIPYGRVKPALEYLEKHLKGSRLDFSFRTSTHVHVNVLELNEVQLMNFIYTYLLLEEPLVNFCGAQRVNNRFCLRLQDAEGLRDCLVVLFSQGLKKIAGNLREDRIRYAALNLAALNKYGSLEFRSMRGTLDVKVLTTWVDALNSIREYAMRMQDPIAIYEEFTRNAPADFAQIVLGDTAKEFNYENFERGIQTGFSLTIDFPFLYRVYLKAQKDQEEREKREIEEVKRIKERFRQLEPAGGVPIPAPVDIHVNIARQARVARPRVNPIPLDWEPVNIAQIVLAEEGDVAADPGHPANW